jgi:peptidyl-prolyl cis-trans isomerase C
MTMNRRSCARACCLAAAMLVGCETAPTASPPRSAPNADAAATTPIAFWRGRAIRRSDLDTALAELSGGMVLREHLLDRRLAELAAERGIAVDEAMIERERQLLLDTIAEDPDRAAELLAAVRARQGLGPARFEALLRRNAILRALVAGEIAVDEAAIERIHDVRHGPRRIARIIVAAELAEASRLAEAIANGEDFATLAFEHSTDSSRGVGGLVTPITRLDPAWPNAFRDALYGLAPGETSPPVLADGSWVLIRFIEEEPGDEVAIESVRPELERLARIQLERVRMDRVAREAAESLEPDIVDPVYRESWRRLGM